MGIVGLIQDRIPGAKDLAVAFTGQMTGQRGWSGRAVAEEPIVGMTILVAGSRFHWVKATARDSEISIDLRLSPYDEGERDVQVVAGVGETSFAHDAFWRSKSNRCASNQVPAGPARQRS